MADHTALKHLRGYSEGFQEGVAEGKTQALNDLLNWLSDRYIANPERPDRGSPRAEALLTVTRELAAHFRGEL